MNFGSQLYDVDIYAVGIDPSCERINKARLKLDEAICCNVASAGMIERADVVICANVINILWALCSRRNRDRIFQDSVKLLKPGGIIITDAFHLPQKSLTGLFLPDDYEKRCLCRKSLWSRLFEIDRKVRIYQKY